MGRLIIVAGILALSLSACRDSAEVHQDAATSDAVKVTGCSTNGPCQQLILQAPQDYQVIQRNSSNRADVIISSSLTGGGHPVTLTAIAADGRTIQQTSTVLPGAHSFSSSLNLPAGGWYQILVQEISGSTVVAQGSVAHVGIGEVFITAGQSNSIASGDTPQINSALVSGAILKNSNPYQLSWSPQIDLLPFNSNNLGSAWPVFASLLSEKLNLPVGIIQVGCGGTATPNWLPADVVAVAGDTNYAATGSNNCNTTDTTELPFHFINSTAKGALFNGLVGAAQAVGGSFRAVLWHQGESDAGGDIGTPAQIYHDALALIISRLNQTLPQPVPWFVANASYVSGSEVDNTSTSHTCNMTGLPVQHARPATPAMQTVRQGQQMLWNDGTALQGPDTDGFIGSNFRSYNNGIGNCTHFSSNGLKLHGSLWYRSVTESGIVPGSETVSGRSLKPVYIYNWSASQNFADFFYWPSAASFSGYSLIGPAFNISNTLPPNAGYMLYECMMPSNAHFLSIDPNCEGYGSTNRWNMGYVTEYGGVIWTRPIFRFHNADRTYYLTTPSLDSGFNAGLSLDVVLGFTYLQ